MCAALFQNVVREYQRRSIDPEEARCNATDAALRNRITRRPRKRQPSECALPFSELLILYVGANLAGYSFHLTEMLPFMSLPSLQCIILGGVRDDDFPDWQANEARPNCPEIYFQQAQSRGRPFLHLPKVSARPARSDSGVSDTLAVLASLNIRFGIGFWLEIVRKVGPVLIWLYHGKMHDWRRMDE
ncbi:hypothetical protein LTR09_011729 [Extremus antarcticus]|uniref:Uncharacterized protein n=1 Tax=Extremus antarcticus TaxID=702011 RepID=A0AAJ0DB80_9PEZI|nr:hypothetical protein LTR09_011729 [Extremus antarcticus]